MNVPCIASLRLARRHVGAAARIACQAIARANIEAHISPRLAATSPGLEASRLATTRSTPMRLKASSVSATASAQETSTAARRNAFGARPARAGTAAGSGPSPRRLGSRSAGIRGSRSAGARPWRTAMRPTRVAGRPMRSACS